MEDLPEWAQAYLRGLFEQRAHDEGAQRLAIARTWPGFAQREGEIKAAMLADCSLSLQEAYFQVLITDDIVWTLTPDGSTRRQA